MNEHAGPACVLSVLIVAAFAILLHDKNPPPTNPQTPVREITDALPRSVPNIAPASTASRGRQAEGAPVPPPSPAKQGEMVAVPITAPEKLAATAASGGLSPPPAEARSEGGKDEAKPEGARRPTPSGPRPPFTVVGPGETLIDVARRIYGSTDATQAIWKANRDQLERIDSTLARGTLLRTP